MTTVLSGVPRGLRDPRAGRSVDHVDAAHDLPDYAVVGKVVSGIDVVERIGRLGDSSSPTGAPTKTVVLDKASVRGV